jgi:hypothetical protein
LSSSQPSTETCAVDVFLHAKGHSKGLTWLIGRALFSTPRLYLFFNERFIMTILKRFHPAAVWCFGMAIASFNWPLVLSEAASLRLIRQLGRYGANEIIKTTRSICFVTVMSLP